MRGAKQSAADGRPWFVGFFVLILLGTFVARYFEGRNSNIFFDGCGYVMHAWSIAGGQLTTPYWAGGVDHYYPPLYPLFIVLFHQFQLDWVTAAKAVSLIFSFLMLAPFYLLAKRMFNWTAAIFSVALLLFFPLLAEVGTNAYSEPVFMLFYALSMLCAWQTVSKQKSYLAVAAGLSLGLAYLARTQATPALASILLYLLWSWLGSRRIGSRNFIKFCFLSLVGFFILALPYDAYSYRQNQVWGLRLRHEFFKKGYRFQKDLEWEIREKTLDPAGRELINFHQARLESPLTFVRNEPLLYVKYVVLDISYIFERMLREQRLAPPVILILWFILIESLIFSKRYSRFKDPGVFLVCWFVPMFAAIPMVCCTFDRYFIALIPPLALGAAAGLAIMFDKLVLVLRSIFTPDFSRLKIMAIILVLIPFTFPHYEPQQAYGDKAQMKYQKEANRRLGKFIEERIGSTRNILLCPSPEPALYSGNYWYLMPAEKPERIIEYARSSGVKYLLFQKNMFAHHGVDYYSNHFFQEGEQTPGLKFLGHIIADADDPCAQSSWLYEITD